MLIHYFMIANDGHSCGINTHVAVLGGYFKPCDNKISCIYVLSLPFVNFGYRT